MATSRGVSDDAPRRSGNTRGISDTADGSRTDEPVTDKIRGGVPVGQGGQRASHAHRARNGRQHRRSAVAVRRSEQRHRPVQVRALRHGSLRTRGPWPPDDHVWGFQQRTAMERACLGQPARSCFCRPISRLPQTLKRLPIPGQRFPSGMTHAEPDPQCPLRRVHGRRLVHPSGATVLRSVTWRWTIETDRTLS